MNQTNKSSLLAILALQFFGALYFLWFIIHYGHLPSPFVFEKYDTLMDLFNTMYWADHTGRYTEWKSVYPPLNFIFLKFIRFIFLGNASYPSPLDLRDAATPVAIFFVCTYLIIPALVIRTKLWLNIPPFEKILLYLIIILCTPMLFALERGNLIIFSLILIALVLSSSGLKRAIWLALLINLKPYFALLVLYYFLRRDWKGFWQCALLSSLLFVATGLLLDQNFLYFFVNIFDFSIGAPPFSLKTSLALASSISVFSNAFNEVAFHQATKYSHYFNLHAIASMIGAVKWIVLSWTIVELIKKQRLLSDNQIIAVLLVIITNLGISVGGYSLIFYVALLPVFFTMKYWKIYFTILTLMILPLDFMPLSKSISGEQYSYLTNSIVEVNWTLGVGSLIKPLLNFSLLIVLLQEIRLLPGYPISKPKPNR